MAYFANNYIELKYPSLHGATGLYNAQIGAIHAIASHFTIDDRSAIITMPTGSGKTAVLMMAPFVLKATRVLVVTPSQFVRWQIANEFKTLSTLKAVGALARAVPNPRVIELKNRIEDEAGWNRLLDFDVVVSTPNCCSPGHAGIPVPPDGLFDLILIDEAHHSPARTWAELLDAFANQRRILFTATPYRRDRAEIQGKFVYTYPVARAFHDRIFGRIRYVPVIPGRDDASTDIAIAQQTNQVFDSDRAAGLNHYVMVRTDRKKRADDLAEIYAANTNLTLAVVHSGQSALRVRRVLDDLEASRLDGLICVNMLGEGFNFPRLKIAAIHSPHRSLEVTLQFIGRFARTNAPDIGEAKFVGAINDIEIEGERLFSEGVVWQEIVTNLAHGRVDAERQVRESLDEFDRPIEGDVDFEDLSLYSIYPRNHVKVYDTRAAIDLRTPREIPEALNVKYRNVNDTGTTLVLITRTIARPKWSAGPKIVDTSHELVVVFVDNGTHLMFVNSSLSNEGLYEMVAQAIDVDASPLPTNLVRRVVQGIQNQRIFNIGMRNILASNTTESYRIIAGPNTEAAIRPSDARVYRQGHAFLSGEEGGSRVTIGYSSLSKIWSAASEQIPGLIEWCRLLGRKIRSTGAIVTHSGLDYLSPGIVVDRIPQHLVHVGWDKDAFDLDPPVQVEYRRDDGVIDRGHILDVELEIDRAHTDEREIAVIASAPGLASYPIEFRLEQFYESGDGDPGRIRVVKGGHSVTLIEYLNHFYLDFFTAGGALLRGNELFEPPDRPELIDVRQIEVWNWAGVAIRSEVTAGAGSRSVHDEVRGRLVAGDADVVIYDHGSGEVADFVAFRRAADALQVSFYHCKGSGGPQPGARVDDIYEVCSQAQKSVGVASLQRLVARLRARRQHYRFVRGTSNELDALLEYAKTVRTRFEIVVVQPGVSAASLSEGMREPLGATDGHLRQAGCAPLRIVVSP